MPREGHRGRQLSLVSPLHAPFLEENAVFVRDELLTSLERSVTPATLNGCSLVLQILVFSFETGQEVVLRGGTRLSTYVRSGDQGTAGVGVGSAAAAVVAASASPDNKTLAVACAGSGTTTVTLVFFFLVVPGIC